MKLRKLEEKDKMGIMEWMNDSDIMSRFRMSKEAIDEKKVQNFILNSFTEIHQHFAIVDEQDNYLGTISLKNINIHDRNAEYAIVLRSAAIGKSIAFEATTLLLNYSFGELKLHKVYLNVLEENQRAVKFYEKYGFIYEGTFKEHILHEGAFKNLMWFSITNPNN